MRVETEWQRATRLRPELLQLEKFVLALRHVAEHDPDYNDEQWFAWLIKPRISHLVGWRVAAEDANNQRVLGAIHRSDRDEMDALDWEFVTSSEAFEAAIDHLYAIMPERA